MQASVEDYQPLHRTRQHGSLNQVIADGNKVTEITQHEENENLNVIVKMPDSDEEMIYTNVKPGHIEKLRETYPDSIGDVAKIENLKKGEHADKLVDMMKEPGAKIVDWHPTRTPYTYSIHVQTDDGERHAYSSVSEPHMKQFIPDFKPGSSYQPEE
ncbi:hypothetical protein HDU76_001948 [Blyttiomyces sp. JEL0837]|nr:hypothetical protein HDU76_001948 [Blyttiomyces sp. JEL0837]